MTQSFDFTAFMKRVGEIFVRELQSNVSRQVGIDGRPYTPIAPSTVKARTSVMMGGTSPHVGGYFNRRVVQTRGLNPTASPVRKGTPSGVPTTRLYFTHRFWKGAFQYAPLTNGVRVYVSDDMYPGHWTQAPVSYGDIVRFNNRGSAELNLHIKDAPLIFPNNSEEAMQLKSYEEAIDLIVSELKTGGFADQFTTQAMGVAPILLEM